MIMQEILLLLIKYLKYSTIVKIVFVVVSNVSHFLVDHLIVIRFNVNVEEYHIKYVEEENGQCLNVEH